MGGPFSPTGGDIGTWDFTVNGSRGAPAEKRGEQESSLSSSTFCQQAQTQPASQGLCQTWGQLQGAPPLVPRLRLSWQRAPLECTQLAQGVA